MCSSAKVPPLQALSGLCTSFPSRPNITKFHRDEEIRVNSCLCIHSSKLGMGGGEEWESQSLCKEAGNGMGISKEGWRQVGEGRWQGKQRPKAFKWQSCQGMFGSRL